MQLEDLQQIKAQCLNDLTEALPRFKARLDAIDPRLYEYASDAISNNASHASLHELLGIRRELRKMDSYIVRGDRVQLSLKAIEGVWKNGKHMKGGLKFSTPRGNMHVRLMPFQTWVIFGIYVFDTEVSMERPYKEGEELLPTEYRGEDGMVWDRRRLTQEAHVFIPRKSGKTELGAAIDFTEVCFLGPVNGQALICTNSASQSDIAFAAIREFASQVDPTCLNRMGGNFFRMTRKGLNWQPGHKMKGEIRTMAAGKTSKDGLYASVVHADEHGQARYINGVSDMQQAVETCFGSTGPRREKLLLHTTTAGNISEGPYKSKIESVEALLLGELEIPLDGQPHRTDDDQWFALLCQLDKWDITDDLDRLDDPELFKKVNKAIGITVQPSYYRERLREARNSDDTKKEVLTKDFNMWQTARITQWIKPQVIMPLQRPGTIDDCVYWDGWRVFVGCDFSHGDDLFALTYLAVNYNHQGETMRGLMFADMEAWVLEETLKQSPNRALYELWIADGWLKVCPGAVFDSAYAINAMASHLFAPRADGTPDEQQMRLDIRMIGYDPAQSVSPINNIKAWLQSIFTRRGLSGAEIAEAIKQMVVPVSQGSMAMNPIIGHLEEIILAPDPWIEFSQNPMWPWQFGNVAIEYGRNDLRRFTKGGPAASHKHDNLSALADAVYCFDITEGRIEG